MKEKRVKDSYVEMRELVLPNDTNILGNLLGGTLMHLIDIAGAMVASRHSNSVVATASIDSVDFKRPIKVGEMIILKAKLTCVGRTSMEVLVEVFSEDYLKDKIKFTNKAYLTFVALDKEGKPCEVPRLILETDEEKVNYEEGKIRKENRLRRIHQ
jgi:acyl-CoA hydrolase